MISHEVNILGVEYSTSINAMLGREPRPDPLKLNGEAVTVISAQSLDGRFNYASVMFNRTGFVGKPFLKALELAIQNPM